MDPTHDVTSGARRVFQNPNIAKECRLRKRSVPPHEMVGQVIVWFFLECHNSMLPCFFGQRDLHQVRLSQKDLTLASSQTAHPLGVQTLTTLAADDAQNRQTLRVCLGGIRANVLGPQM